MNATEQIRRELLSEFRQSARERLERIGAAWVALESETVVAEQGPLVLRELHTLKGEAKLMGFGAVSQLTHHTEDLVVAVGQRGFRRAAEVGDLVLRAVDALGRLIAVESSDATPPEIADLEARLGACARGLTAPADPATAAPAAVQPPAVGSPEPVGRDAFVRVDVATAHRLAEEAGEGVIGHARYLHAVGALRACCDDLGVLVRALADRLGGGLSLAPVHARLAETIERLADDLHGGSLVARSLELDARRLRLVPVAPLFRAHLRAVRELARELGKQAALQIADGGVAVDREVVERLGDPLLHLLRNCVDHGLEAPAVRRAAGKPETGRITVSAERAGGEVVVVVEDDGAGVDIAAVRRRGLEQGLIDAGDSPDESALLGLLFAPGFSTRRQATETSGRGVGLDVVKRQVESLGGSVRVSSQRGQGTRFELRAPVSVALTRALIVEEHGQRFAIPHAAVEAVIGVDAASIELIHTRRHLRFRDGRIPVVELAAALQLPATAMSGRELRAIVLRHEDQRVALVVDAWRGDAEVVIKPLGEVARSRAVIGACTLEGGELALVLSPSELMTRALGEVPRIRLAAQAPRAAADHRVLLVEDSAITRTMIAQLLRMLGYQVAEAEDGARALRILEDFAADLVITDVEMPQIDGIELLRRLRADARWRSIPAIVLSTRGSAEDKARAISAGADAYLVKTEFSESALRDVLARHLGGKG